MRAPHEKQVFGNWWLPRAGVASGANQYGVAGKMEVQPIKL
jgi:hypothetical protein